MILLNTSQLYELTEAILKEFQAGSLEMIVASLNRKGKLLDWLKMMGMEQLLCGDVFYNPRSNGKVLVLGGTRTNQRHLEGIAKELGITRQRIEFCLDYYETVNFNYGKLQYSDKYAAIIVGPIPHSTSGKGDYSSAIVAMESEDGYPPVYRVEKISNNSFRSTMKKMIEENVLAA